MPRVAVASLRSMIAWITLLFVVVSVCVAGVLVWTTRFVHATARAASASVESVRLAEEAEIDLLLHQRANDPIVQRSIEDELQDYLVESREYAREDGEASALEHAEEEVDALVAASRADGTAQPERTQAAYDALEDLVDVNVAHASDTARTAASLATVASVLGIAASALLLLAGAAILAWLRYRAFAPLFALSREMSRVRAGDLSARTKEEGASEFRTLARGFNSMAETIETQREQQMTFIAGVAHDLRNPLSALKMSSALIAPGRPPLSEERLHQVAERILRQIDRIERMVSDLMDVARIEAGKLELSPETIDLRDAVRTTIDLFAPTSPSHQLVVVAPDTPVRVECDPNRLEQVLNNLVSNAIKYSPNGGTITTTISRANDAALISVQDGGLGISPDQLEHVFDSFHRAGASKRISGQGLGLFVAKSIVEAHGGRIDVTSTVGKGSTFTVRLPLRQPVHAPEVAPALVPQPA